MIIFLSHLHGDMRVSNFKSVKHLVTYLGMKLCCMYCDCTVSVLLWVLTIWWEHKSIEDQAGLCLVDLYSSGSIRGQVSN